MKSAVLAISQSPMSAAIERTTEPAAAEPGGRPGLLARLFEPVPIAPLVLFRIALGLILLWEAYRYISAGWPRSLFLDRFLETPEFERPFLFKYFGFEWVRPLPETLHLAVFPVLGVLAVCVTLGAFYRATAALLFLGWAYVFLLDQTYYLNHLYLVTLVIGLMALLPANRAYSLDALMIPAMRRDLAPRWTLALLRFQVALPYFFGGIAKLGGDWLSGVPMQQMLLERADLFGQAAGEPWVALFFAYGGLLLDLFIVPLLYWKRTRVLALLLAAGFHLTNHVVFRIGIFPWTMMAATLILWPPFPLSLVRFARIYGVLVLLGMIPLAVRPVEGRELPLWAWSIVPALAAVWTIDFWWPQWRRYDLAPEPQPGGPPVDTACPRIRPAVVAFLGVYLLWQILLPLRHWAYPGDVNWTEEGHKWSWQMKLRVKLPASAMFYVYDRDGALIDLVDPAGADSPLSPRQARTMVTRPELALQFAHDLARTYETRGEGPVKVTAMIRVALDGREPALLIDPKADLAAARDRLWPPAEWILPLKVKRPPLQRKDVTPFLAPADGAEPDDL